MASRLLAALVAAALLGPGNATTTKKWKLPSFDRVSSTAEELFRSRYNYRDGDIISRSQVQTLFEQLRHIGWTVRREQQDELLDRMLDDNNFLVRQMRTSDGRKFAAQIARYPNAYDRLDRLARMPTGRSAVARLIKGPDGYKMLDYMATTPWGHNMGQMLSDTPTGRDFNKPTGRIYMLSDLLSELEDVYKQTVRAMQNANANNPAAPLSVRGWPTQ
ncbi:MAG: hypothetical protein HYX69_03385 [Planctomycetia bacterium]|nr:hypothetical protein [Planctomycetia bacterium]